MENCVPCEIGKYKDERGNNTCKSCDAGYTTAGSGSDNKQDCNVCKYLFKYAQSRTIPANPPI